MKDNQKALHEEIKDYFVYMKKRHADVITKSTHTEVDAGHGRIEQHIYRQLLVNDLITESSKWAGIYTVIEVERRRELKGKIEEEIQYYISSLSVNLLQITDTIRGHWEVESAPQAHEKEVYVEHKLRACA